MPPITNTMQWETVAVPVQAGVQLNTRARLVDAAELTVAENVYYNKSGGPEKRRGHDTIDLYDAFIGYQGNAPSSNLYGFGLVDLENLPTLVGLSGKSDYPQIGTIRDLVVYEDRELAWDGWRLFEPLNPGIDGKCRVINAILPTITVSQTANTNQPQDFSCACDNGVIRLVGYVEIGTPNVAFAKVYDVATGSLKFTYQVPTVGPVWVRTINCGAYCHFLVADLDSEELRCYTFHEAGTDVYSILTVCTLDAGTGGVIDVWKWDETRFLVGGLDTDVLLTWINANGTANETMFTQATAVAISEVVDNFAIAVHPVSREISVFYNTTAPEQRLKLFQEDGTALGASAVVDSLADCYHLAVSPTYVSDHFNYYYDSATGPTVIRKTYKGSALQSSQTRYNLFLASRAIRVGQLSFIWATNPLDIPINTFQLQSTRFLLDLDLLPVANCDYGTAVHYTEPKWLPSINYVVSDDGVWNTTRFHGTHHYNERIDNEFAGDGTAYSHKAIKFYNINFTPDKLSYDRAGKCVYIAAGLLWSYDGETLREANFPAGIENTTVIDTSGAGNITGNNYLWRVDICYRNAHNEECRARSFLTKAPVGPLVSKKAVLTWQQVPTRNIDAYYLMFRNEASGDLWYLVTDRDNPPKYDTTSATIDIEDNLADSDILDNEQHPANALNFIEPIAAPASELITFGQNRLWLAGGELSPGEVWPSRLFYPGQTPAFNWVLAVQVDTDNTPVTALAFQSDYGVVFKFSSTYLVTGNVMPNIMNLAIAPNTQLAYADRGCVNSKSIVKLYNSIAFQSENGYKIIDASGQMQDIGFPVENVRGNCIGGVIVKLDEHARFYQSDEQSLVFDYRRKLWSTFNFNTKPSAAVYSNRTRRAVLAIGTRLLYENDSAFTDGGFEFNYRIKTGPLAQKIGGLQRVRRVYCIGERTGIPPAVTMRIYTNTHDYWAAQVRWDYSDDLNTSTFSDGTFDAPYFGDTNSSFRDDIWKWRFRLPDNVQKCEDVQIELTDKGRITSASRWVPTAFALEVGTKNGLDRLGPRTIVNE